MSLRVRSRIAALSGFRGCGWGRYLHKLIHNFGELFTRSVVTIRILAMDVETEILHPIPLPEYNEKLPCHFEVMGNSLSMLTSRSACSWSVWMLKDA